MTFGQFLKLYVQQSKMNINDFAKFINSNVNSINSWLNNNNLPQYKVRCAILLKLNKTLDNSKLITIKDSDGFSFELKPKMAAKYQSEKGRQKYYESARWEKLKQKVFERADYKCEICGCKGTGPDKKIGLNIHHLVYNEDFGTGKEDLGELICLCNQHHSLVHSSDTQAKQEAYENRTDGKYKILILEKTNGEKEVKLFDFAVSDKQIKAYVAKIQYKYHFKYKNITIKEL